MTETFRAAKRRDGTGIKEERVNSNLFFPPCGTADDPANDWWNSGSLECDGGACVSNREGVGSEERATCGMPETLSHSVCVGARHLRGEWTPERHHFRTVRTRATRTVMATWKKAEAAFRCLPAQQVVALKKSAAHL